MTTTGTDGVPTGGDALAPEVARMALRQTSLTEVLGLLAYAEGFGLVIASLGVAIDPRRVVREAFATVIDGRAPWAPAQRTLPAHVRGVLRAALAARLGREAQARMGRGRPFDELRMAATQVGDLAGVAELAHAAGELMGFVRSGDPALLRVAVVICDAVRARLDACAAADGGADTAPIVVPPRLPPPPPPRAVPATVDEDEPSARAAPRVIRDEPTPRPTAVRPAPAPTGGSRAAIDLARLAEVADGVPLALGSTDGEPDPVTAVRDLDTARIGRLSRAELVRLIAAHPGRVLEADLLEELPDGDLRDELRALRGLGAVGAPS